MKTVWLICYDVADPKRLRKTHRKMLGYGDALQYSVFRCELTAQQRQQLREELWELLNFAEDRIMLVNLGPAGARGDECIEFWGDPCSEPAPRRTLII